MLSLTPPPLSRVSLRAWDPGRVIGPWNKKTAAEQIARNTRVSSELAYRLFAENRRAVLVVLQGMDTSGKDGTIRTVMTGINPQSFQITSFRQPSVEELQRDFLWRIHQAVPRKGHVGVFNRSHYEDVLIVRVRQLAPESVWKRRYDRINEFEQLLTEGGVTLVKCFLHISREEQRERLQARLDDPQKRWKFSPADLEERKLWPLYQKAYEDALTRCNTPQAPWHVIPSDRKWFRNLTVSQIFRETLERLNPQFPPPSPGLEGLRFE
jgi:PPK2 family polyphosphate:nucleotide phosphotransferase